MNIMLLEIYAYYDINALNDLLSLKNLDYELP